MPKARAISVGAATALISVREVDKEIVLFSEQIQDRTVEIPTDLFEWDHPLRKDIDKIGHRSGFGFHHPANFDDVFPLFQIQGVAFIFSGETTYNLVVPHIDIKTNPFGHGVDAF
jgi:hypothetical protein